VSRLQAVALTDVILAQQLAVIGTVAAGVQDLTDYGAVVAQAISAEPVFIHIFKTAAVTV
jgi:hypothetical protein